MNVGDSEPSANASWGTTAKPSSNMTNMLLSQVMAGRQNNNPNAMPHVASAVTSMTNHHNANNNNNNNMSQQYNLMAAVAQQRRQQEQNKREMEALDQQQPQAQRPKLEEQPQQAPGIPRTITLHTHLLERGNAEGARLYSCYMLSIDELYRLPPTPSDDEYCARLNVPGMTATMIPGSHLAALSASRFAELALGAIVNNEISLGMELCNAVVHCLRESVQEPVQIPITFEVAKAYFLLGIFRALRGDMARYFKYRRVCMAYLTKIEVRQHLDRRRRRRRLVTLWPEWIETRASVPGNRLTDTSCCISRMTPTRQSCWRLHPTWIRGRT